MTKNKNDRFFMGNKVRVISEISDTTDLVRVLESYNGSRQKHEEVIVPKFSMYPLIENEVAIGDKVRSTLTAIVVNFTGTVVGYEPITNRAICKSDRDKSSDRTRYAYFKNEIELVPKEPPYIELIPGKWYLITTTRNSMFRAFAVQTEGTVTLFNEKGQLVFVAADSKLALYRCALAGINHIAIISD